MISDFFKKFIGGLEDFVIEIHRSHERLHGDAYGSVVIDDEDRWRVFCLRSHYL